jgi:dihydroneopterin aldolase
MSAASLTPFGPVERDSIIIRSLSVMPRISDKTSSEQDTHQPALVHLRVVPWDGFSGSIKHDRLCSDTLSYFDLSKRIIGRLSHELPFPSVHHLLDELQLSILRDIEEQQAINGARLIDAFAPPRVDYELTIEFPSLISLANRLSLSRSTTIPDLTRIQIDEIKTYSIIGILPHERTQKQTMLISLVLWNKQSLPLDIQSLTRSVYQVRIYYFYLSVSWRQEPSTLILCYMDKKKKIQKIIESEFHTVEALADSIAKHVLNFQGSHPPSTSKAIERVTVSVEKPEAVSCAAGVGVQITRSSNSQ